MINCPLPSLPLSVILHRTSVKVIPVSTDDDEEHSPEKAPSPAFVQKEVVSEVKSLRIDYSKPRRVTVNHLKTLLNGLESLEKLHIYNLGVEVPEEVLSSLRGTQLNRPPRAGPRIGARSGPVGPSRVFVAREDDFSSLRRYPGVLGSRRRRSVQNNDFFTTMSSLIRASSNLMSTMSSNGNSNQFSPFTPPFSQGNSASTSFLPLPRPVNGMANNNGMTNGHSRHPQSNTFSNSFSFSMPTPVKKNQSSVSPNLTTLMSRNTVTRILPTMTTSSEKPLHFENSFQEFSAPSTTSSSSTSPDGRSSINHRLTVPVVSPSSFAPSVTTTESPLVVGDVEINPFTSSFLEESVVKDSVEITGASSVTMSSITSSPSGSPISSSDHPSTFSVSSQNNPHISLRSDANTVSVSVPTPSVRPVVSSYSPPSQPMTLPTVALPTETTNTPFKKTTLSTAASTIKEDELLATESTFQVMQNVLNLQHLLPKLKGLTLDTFLIEKTEGNSLLLKAMVKDLKNLDTVQLRNNHVPILLDHTFNSSSPTLKRLYLIGNNISRVQDRALEFLSSLQVLDLHSNSISRVSDNVFQDLKNLNILRLGRNQFTNIPSGLVRHCRSLKFLDLSQNRNVSHLPPGFLSSLVEVTNFTMTDADLRDISPDTFVVAPMLEKIEMRGNKIRNLTAFGLFGRNQKLRKIDMSYNDIASVSPFIFSVNSSSITELNLYGNELTVLDVGVFDSLKNLRVLKLGFNNLKTISPDLLFNLRKLEELDLSRNELVSVNQQKSRLPFGLGTAFLRRINLSRNNLTDFEEFAVIDWTLYLKIQDVILSGNQINGRVRLPVFHSTAHQVILDLSGNDIVSVDMMDILRYEETVIHAARTGFLDDDHPDDHLNKRSNNGGRRPSTQALTLSQVIIRLDRNPLSCDCHLSDFVSYANASSSEVDSATLRGVLNRVSFDFYSPDLKCSSPPALSGKEIHLVQSSNLTCQILSNGHDGNNNLCPQECSCFYRSNDKHVFVDCQDNGLQSIPDSIVNPDNYVNISLQEPSKEVTNSFTSLETASSSRHETSSSVKVTLVTLLLSNNQITDVDSLTDILYHPSRKRSLGDDEPLSFQVYLDNNRIKDLPSKRQQHRLNFDEETSSRSQETASLNEDLTAASAVNPDEDIIENNDHLGKHSSSSLHNNNNDGLTDEEVSESSTRIRKAKADSIVLRDSRMHPKSMIGVLSLRNNFISVIPNDFLQLFGKEDGISILDESRVVPVNESRTSQKPLNPRDKRRTQLYLGRNPYNCSENILSLSQDNAVCQVVIFKHWLTRNYDIVMDIKDISCHTESSDASSEEEGTSDSKSLIETPDAELCPSFQKNDSTLFASIASLICIFLSMLVVILCIVYYRNKQTILAFIYIHVNPVFICLNFSEDDIDEDKLFDAFVSYSSSDRDIVMELIRELEEPSDLSNHSISFLKQQTGMPSIHEGHSDQIVPEHSVHLKNSHNRTEHGVTNKSQNSDVESGTPGADEQHYKLCIHERDWLPGNLISWNIVNSVQNSRRTILILSKEFIQSIWFQVEFHTAYYQMLEDKMDRVIVVVRGELPPKEELDKDLVFLLTTKTYLTWGEKWFWEKLRYALPHKSKNRKNSVISFPFKSNKTASTSSPNKQSKADIMREYVDQTISDHFQLKQKATLDNRSSNARSSNRGSKRAKKSTESREAGQGVVNEGFVHETET